MLALHVHAALLEHAKHAAVVRQHLGNEGADAGAQGDQAQVAKQKCADTAPLPGIRDGLDQNACRDGLTNRRSMGSGSSAGS